MSEPEPASAPPEQKPLRRAVLDALLGLVKLTGLFLPEMVVAVLGVIVGVVIGIVVGVGATSDLFSGPGPWARAGPIALILPLLTSLGPPLLGALLGAVVPPAMILPPHAIIVGVIARHAYRDRYVVLWAVAAMVWLPALFFVAHGVRGALGTALVLSPLTAAFGFVAGALFVSVRGVLGGRSLGQFWRDADGSMVLAMVVLTAYGALVTWLVCVLFCLLPTVPIALLLAIALAARLIAKKNHRGLAITTLIVNTLHIALIVFAIVAMSQDRSSSSSDSGASSSAVSSPPPVSTFSASFAFVSLSSPRAFRIDSNPARSFGAAAGPTRSISAPPITRISIQPRLSTDED